VNDPNPWHVIEVDDIQAGQPTGDGPEPDFAPCQGDAGGRWVDGPGTSWRRMRTVDCGEYRFADRGEFGYVLPPIDQLASRSDDLAAPRLRLTTKSATTARRPPTPAALARLASATALPRMGACARRSVIPCSASVWLSLACWSFMFSSLLLTRLCDLCRNSDSLSFR
jgi:hypothetical protein